jgi:hypothetical protein
MVPTDSVVAMAHCVCFIGTSLPVCVAPKKDDQPTVSAFRLHDPLMDDSTKRGGLVDRVTHSGPYFVPARLAEAPVSFQHETMSVPMVAASRGGKSEEQEKETGYLK